MALRDKTKRGTKGKRILVTPLTNSGNEKHDVKKTLKSIYAYARKVVRLTLTVGGALSSLVTCVMAIEANGGFDRLKADWSNVGQSMTSLHQDLASGDHAAAFNDAVQLGKAGMDAYHVMTPLGRESRDIIRDGVHNVQRVNAEENARLYAPKDSSPEKPENHGYVREPFIGARGSLGKRMEDAGAPDFLGPQYNVGRDDDQVVPNFGHRNMSEKSMILPNYAAPHIMYHIGSEKIPAQSLLREEPSQYQSHRE